MSNKIVIIFTIIKAIITLDESNIYNSSLKNTDIFGKYYDKAKTLLKKMTLEEKVGQVFNTRYDNKTKEELKTYHYGGLTLFANHFENKTKSQLLSELKDLDKLSKLNLSFAVDEEGGKVVRISKYKAFRNESFKSPQEYYKEGGIPKILEAEKEKRKFIKDLYLNINFAPVADFTTDPSSYIHFRTLGQNLSETEKYIGEVVKAANNDKFTTCLKHFPGYGSNGDTHKESIHDTRELEEFRKIDFKPFIAGIKEKVPMIMVSHNIIDKVDPIYPSSISAKIHKILREELNYTGLIITDDISMGAITYFKKNDSIPITALLCGNDIILTSNNSESYKELLGFIKKNDKYKIILDNAVTRILAYKLQYGIVKFDEGSSIFKIIIIILAVVLVVGVLVYFFVFRKRDNSSPDFNEKLTNENGF